MPCTFALRTSNPPAFASRRPSRAGSDSPVDARQRVRAWRAALAAALLAATPWIAVSADDPPGALSSPLQEPDTRPAAATRAPHPLEEEIPPFGKGNMLSESQLRYCLAEIIRIEAVRPVMNRYRHDQVAFFNALIAAYNSRCAKYRYELPAMDRAKYDVETNRSRIESAAQEAFLKRFQGPEERPDQAVAEAAPAPQTQEVQRSSSSHSTPATPSATASVHPPQPQAGAAPQSPAPPVTQAQTAKRAEPPHTPVTASEPSTPTSTQLPQVAQTPQARSERPAQSPAATSATTPPPPPPAQMAQPQVARAPEPALPAEPTGTASAAREPAPPAQPQTPQIPAPAVESQAGRPEPAAQAPEPTPSAPRQALQAAVSPGPEPTTKAVTAPPPSLPTTVAAASPAASEPKSGIPVPPQSPAAVAQPPATPGPEPSAQTQPAATEAKPTPPPAELAHAAPSRPGSKGAGTKGAGTKDSALARFERDIQKAGKRVIDKRRLPELANMGKNWAGKTEIEVQFAAGGYISRIVLAESCGNAPLDEKALELARSIMFPHVPKELSSREFNVRFPIEFRPGKG